MPSRLSFARLLIALVLAFVSASWLRAQVPQLLNYQGRVAVGGVNFSGTGQFRFALVNAAGTTTYWSNDGSSSSGSQPTAAITLTVANGLYSVLLGDASIPNMTAVPATVFSNPDVRLRVWFNDGANGVQLLSPDQRVAAVGYALMADGVRAGGVTSAMIAAGAVGSSQLGAGAVQSSNLAPGAAAANLGASGQGGVPSGGLLLSPTDNNAALLAAGYVRLGATVMPDLWQQRISTVPSARTAHTAVWTGSEMIVWGGQTAANSNDGARYLPSLNVWIPVALTGAPSARSYHTAAWTGTEMIVWGGFLGTSYLGDGARYNPLTDTWTALPAAGAPAGRFSHAAAWTGNEMIVWGGRTGSSTYLGDGARFNPSANAWTALPAAGAPSARSDHTAVWTGAEMIVWGGFSSTGAVVNDGARFNLAANAWTSLPSSGLAARAQHAAAWTGADMLVWGGAGANQGTTYGDGARYSPGSNAWTPLAAANAPSPRRRMSVVWSGAEMIVWGGSVGFMSSSLATGARYNAAADSWAALPTAGAPSARESTPAVWSGTEMIVWGRGSTSVGDGSRYNPSANAWTPMPNVAPPAPRSFHTVVWTGTEMIVWGGTDANAVPLNSGGRYNPAANAWTATTATGAPAARQGHTAVWTGAEMIAWGGIDASAALLNSGGRYNPVADAWTTTATAGAPAARVNHTAVWTGSQMIVWGGGYVDNTSTADFCLNTGGRYTPAADTWAATATAGAPARRYLHTAVWTGSEMIVFGGWDVSYPSNQNNISITDYYDGGRYQPAADAWTSIALTYPNRRFGHAAVWTGREMVVFGGTTATFVANPSSHYTYQAAAPVGLRYDPAASAWTTISSVNEPPGGSVFWTGSEVLVVGNPGARYNPATDFWTALNFSGPQSRASSGATALWTGQEVLVFGGNTATGVVNELFSLTLGRTFYLYQHP